MTTDVLDIARDALEDALDAEVYQGPKVRAVFAALRALIAEHDRLTAPPTEDEHEALNRALTGIVEGGIDQRDAIDAIFAAGFRRQGPVTEAEVDAALDEFKALHFSWAEATAREKMRAALKAAREVIA